jgi:hypothetical protein
MSLDPPRHSASVWPGYVAAVSSLVLSLLLLAGVLVVSISQAGRVVENYNNQLIESVIQSELQAQELEQIKDSAAAAAAAASAKRPTVKPTPADTSKSSLIDMQVRSLSDVQAALVEKTSELNKAQEELVRLKAQNRPAEKQLREAEAIKWYRLIFTAGSEAMDETMLSQLRQQLLRDGALNVNERWQLESGTKGLDAVAEREVYRLMLGVRTQLLAVGLNADQVKVVINRELAPQDLNANKSPQPKGVVIFTLQRAMNKASR